MKALCKRNCFSFKAGNYYNVVSKHSVFEENDFITIENGEKILERFALKKGSKEIEDYISQSEALFSDYFYSEEETIGIDRTKLIERMLE